MAWKRSSVRSRPGPPNLSSNKSITYKRQNGSVQTLCELLSESCEGASACAADLKAFTCGHSDDCKYVNIAVDRDQSRRCNCMRYIAGTAADGTRFRESTGTTSWEKARKILARKLAEHDPVNKPLSGATVSERASPTTKTIADAVDQFRARRPRDAVSKPMGLKRPIWQRIHEAGRC